MSIKTNIFAVSVAVLLASICGPVFADDLSDDAVCMDCHADMERSADADKDKPRIHTDDGGFVHEAHEMWSCIDCHESITDIPHSDESLDAEVNCENCHESTPTME